MADGSTASDALNSSHETPKPTEATADSTPNGHATPPTNDSALTNGDDASKDDDKVDGESPPPDSVLKLRVDLPTAEHVDIMVSSQEQVQDIRQSIVDQPHTFQYSCFHLEYHGARINDFVELSEVPELAKDTEPVLKLVEDPYSEAQARMHLVRVRELIGAAGNRIDYVSGIDAGLSLVEDTEIPISKAQQENIDHVRDYDLAAPGSINSLLPKPRDAAPKTIKSLSLSPWNPPPHHLRMRGHLLYLQATTLEGELYHITAHTTGFYVSRSTPQKFDPEPRELPKSQSRAHSLLTLLSYLSPSFTQKFTDLQHHNGARDPLATYALSTSIPASPWLVQAPAPTTHQADITRTQEPYLLAGADNAETLRDWNEEFQSTRELPASTVPERVFRERLTAKLFAEFNEQAVRGAVLVARGEVQALNPTEGRAAQIFLYGNVFYSFAADGVGTFAVDGGDEAARSAAGRDLSGVRAVNQLDVNGLFTAGTVVVDYLGLRIVGQSIVPGIFRQRAEGEAQIDYGGVEGKEVVATNEGFVEGFREMAKGMRVKPHAVWDKELKRHDLEGSVETKGLLGTDGRRYVLDLYRVTPIDVAWAEQHRDGKEGEERYPHRMTVLRPELVDSYRIGKLRTYIQEQLAKRKETGGEEKKELTNGDAEKEKLTNGTDAEKSEDKPSEETDGEAKPADAPTADAPEPQAALTNGDSKPADAQQQPVDVSGFSFSLNPDVFSGQQPQTEEEKAEMEQDEKDVRAVCTFLTDEVIPRMLREMKEGDVGFPMDGAGLVREMRKRGVNVRYLGMIAKSCGEEDVSKEDGAEAAESLAKVNGSGPKTDTLKADAGKLDRRLEALRALAQQEMVARAFKHIANGFLKTLPPSFSTACVSHLLNCLLGVELNGKPEAEVDAEIKAMYPESDFGFVDVTPEGLEKEIRRQIQLRYRSEVEGELVKKEKRTQMLREVCLKLGVQVEAKEYRFSKETSEAASPQTVQKKASAESLEVPQTNGAHASAEVSDGGSKKKNKKKKTANGRSPSREPVPPKSTSPTTAPTTFRAENILNLVPVVKEASPRSLLAEEALDAGRMSLQQDQKELGQELLLESLSLHEQIYGILHPEVARCYSALSTLYYGLEEKGAAVELARKAVIVSERTLGVDHPETVLAYLNLGLMEHAAGNTRGALAFVRHALELWKIVYGTRHPDSITTINNAAVMLQTLKHFHESRIWFKASLDICVEVAGTESVNTATLYFQYAQALALDHDSKGAVDKMRESRRIFARLLGEENPNTREAASWLETLVKSALNQASAANQASNLLGNSNRRLFLRNGAGAGANTAASRTSRLGLGSRPSQEQTAGASPAEAEAAQRSSGGFDQRSLDELVKYVNGDKSGGKKGGEAAKKKKTTANPKRRTQRAA